MKICWICKLAWWCLTWARTTAQRKLPKAGTPPNIWKTAITLTAKHVEQCLHILFCFGTAAVCTLPLTWYMVDDEAIRGLGVYHVKHFKAWRAIWPRLHPSYNRTPSTLTTYCWQHRWQSESNKLERKDEWIWWSTDYHHLGKSAPSHPPTIHPTTVPLLPPLPLPNPLMLTADTGAVK